MHLKTRRKFLVIFFILPVTPRPQPCSRAKPSGSSHSELHGKRNKALSASHQADILWIRLRELVLSPTVTPTGDV